MAITAEHRSETWLGLGLAFVGGYSDAASYILAGSFTGHITGNSVLAAVSLANRDWLLTISRLLAVGAFLLGILLSSVVDWLVKRKPSRSSLTVALFLEAILIFEHGSKAGNTLRTVVWEKATTSQGDLK